MNRGLYMAQVQSGAERARRRGAGMIIFRPPGRDANRVLWHIVELADGTRLRLQFHPGIDVWRDADGTRWNAETCGEIGMRYIAPAPR